MIKGLITKPMSVFSKMSLWPIWISSRGHLELGGRNFMMGLKFLQFSSKFLLYYSAKVDWAQNESYSLVTFCSLVWTKEATTRSRNTLRFEFIPSWTLWKNFVLYSALSYRQYFILIIARHVTNTSWQFKSLLILQTRLATANAAYY